MAISHFILSQFNTLCFYVTVIYMALISPHAIRHKYTYKYMVILWTLRDECDGISC